MSDKYTEYEWQEKADYEGGVVEAMLGYGLRSLDLKDRGTDFYDAVKCLEEIFDSEEFINSLRYIQDYEEE